VLRHFVSKITGSGLEDDPHRPKVADYGINFSILHSNEVNWCIGTTSERELESMADLITDVDIIILPNISLNALVSEIDEATREKLFNQVKSFAGGQELARLTPTTTFKSVINYLGSLIDDGFDAKNLSVS